MDEWIQIRMGEWNGEINEKGKSEALRKEGTMEQGLFQCAVMQKMCSDELRRNKWCMQYQLLREHKARCRNMKTACGRVCKGCGVYSVQGIGIGGVICNVKYEKIWKGRKSKRKGR